MDHILVIKVTLCDYDDNCDLREQRLCFLKGHNTVPKLDKSHVIFT